MQPSKRCPKCEGSMAEGFILDHGDYGQSKVSTWQAGPPERNFWSGIKQLKKEQLRISTWRCGRCGYLENYALSA